MLRAFSFQPFNPKNLCPLKQDFYSKPNCPSSHLRHPTSRFLHRFRGCPRAGSGRHLDRSPDDPRRRTGRKESRRNPGGGRQGARKVKTISAGNVAFYTIQKLKCGRRSTGSSTVDVYGSGTQINGTTRLTSLDEAAASVDDVGEPLVLHDVLSRDEEDPATKAARKIDWDSFMASLSARDQAIIHCLVEGKPLASLARRRHLNTLNAAVS